METSTRQFPSDNETLADQFFMDLLYSYLQAESSWSGVVGEPRYISKKDIDKDYLYKLFKIGKTTYYNRVKALREKGYIVEEPTRYVLPILEPGRFYLITKEVMTYLINTSNENVIKIYTILGKRYGAWERNGSPGDNPVLFTLEYLARGLGYANAAAKSVRLGIVDILNSLELCGLIEYEIKTVYDKETHNPRQYRVLTRVNKKIDRTINTRASISAIDVEEEVIEI